MKTESTENNDHAPIAVVRCCAEPEEPFFGDDYYEGQPCESCPKCSRSYDDIDFDYQSCSKCGWDEDKKTYNPEIRREPDGDDFMNGDADFLTGFWT